MEGTRHEKVALVIAAYFIGFITAFIAFGMNKIDTEPTVVFDDANAQVNTVASGEVHHAVTSVGLGEDGLFAITQHRKRILSANQNQLSANALSSTGESGFHYNIIEAEASRDGKYIYFCEQLLSDALECDPYVYMLATDRLYPVMKADEPYKPLIAEHASLWTDENLLVLNGAVSVNNEEPWIIN